MKHSISPAFGILPLMLCCATSSYSQAVQPQVPHPPVAPPQVATAKPAPAATKKTTLTPSAAQQMVNRVLQETSELRGLKVLRPVPSGVKSRAAVENMLTRQMQEEYTSNEVVGTELFLKQLGLAPADFNLKSYSVKMLGEQLAGYYDPKTKIFYTTSQVDPLQLETVMAHELTHALQDQHFGLGRLRDWPAHDSDARLAFSALVEGDATLAMSGYAMHNPLRALGVLASSFTSRGKSPVFESGPRILREGLVFPYLKGVTFATELYRLGGWPRVSQAFKIPPQSSEQILHVDKYLAHEAPVQVKLRDVSTTLGKNWKLLDHDVNGEIGLQLVVGEYLKDPAEAERAAAGWAGDRYAIYRGPKGAALVVQDTVWDSELDALQWCQSYARRTTDRLGVAAQSRGALQVWNGALKGKTNGVWIEKRGRRVVILEGRVGSFNPATVLSALWQK